MARVAAILALCALVIAGGAEAQSYQSPADAVTKTRDLSTLLAAVTAADLVSPLSSPTANLTVLAPNNAAFASAVQALGLTPAALLGSSLLSNVLKYHVIPGAVQASALTDGQTVTTLLGQTLRVIKSGNTVGFQGPTNTAYVITPDVQAGNSVVHVIGTVLLPNLGAAPAGAPASGPALAQAIAAYQKGLAPAPSK